MQTTLDLGPPSLERDAKIPLILDFLEWLAREPRSYSDVMEVWRTSCPRLTIWEDAVDLGCVERRRMPGGTLLVSLTAEGQHVLADHRPHA